jgi:hypothetical protein
MVVFGAGASYDSSSSFPPETFPPPDERPPLANQLFEDRPLFVSLRDQFPKCLPVIPYLQRPPAGTSVEHVLETLQSESDSYPERYKQLAAIRYYLHLMLWECGEAWKGLISGVTNYKTLLDQIQRWKSPEDEVLLVTFNYDTLLEDALPTVGINPDSISGYVKGNYKVVKLHGSVNWARPVNASINLAGRSAWQVARELIDRAAELEIGEPYEVVRDHPIGISNSRAVFPALAIPVETKPGYECPPEHLRILEEYLPRVTKVLLVGWRATEKRFLDSMAEKLGRDSRVLVVSSDKDRANEVIDRLRNAGVGAGQFYASKGGFTRFVARREADEFLAA